MSYNQYPVHDPKHNLRELVKECILLERHLFDPSKYCEDCIRKHFLTIEAFAGPELVSLDLDQEYKDIVDRLAVSIPNWQQAWKAGVSPQDIAQDIRECRKALTKACFEEHEAANAERLDMLVYEPYLEPGYTENPEYFEIACPLCSSRVMIAGTGEYECPHCSEIIVISTGGGGNGTKQQL